MIAGMGHDRGPAHHHFVARAKSVFHRQFHIRERAVKSIVKRLEIRGLANLHTRLILAPPMNIFGEQIVNGLHPALIPHFLEPAPH